MASRMRVALAAGVFVACGSEPIEPAPVIHDVPVIQQVLVEFDGRELDFRTLRPGELSDVIRHEVAAGRQPLVELDSYACTTCTGDEYLAFSNVAGTLRAVTNGGPQGTVELWDVDDEENCGTAPTTGVCQQVRTRNLYPQQLERVYAELITLSATGDSDTVAVLDNEWTATNDFGLAPTFTNAMWRIGTMGRNGIATDGVTTYWAFTGTTDPATSFTFRFIVQIRGQIVQPTRRATIVGNDDPAADYPARSAGGAVNTHIDMTPDGRYVVFTTDSPELLPSGISGDYVVRHDMVTGENLILNRFGATNDIPNFCQSGSPSISDDGTRIVFWNHVCALLDPDDVSIHIYLRDITAGTTTLVDVSTTGGYGNGSAQEPGISGDGNVVVFHSVAQNLVVGQPPAGGTRSTTCREVFRRDLSTNTTVHVSAIDGTPINSAAGFAPVCDAGSNSAGRRPDVSDDGNVIVFAGRRPLVPEDTNEDEDFYVYRHGGSNVDVFRVSVSETGAELSPSGFTEGFAASLSGDGAFVAFPSFSTQILGSNGERHVYRRSTIRGDSNSIVRVTETPGGDQGTGSSAGFPNPVLSHNGRFVAFLHPFLNLQTPYNPGGRSFHVCDLGSPEPLLSRCFIANTYQPTATSAFSPILGVNGETFRPAMACADEDEACYVAYLSSADNAPELTGTGLQVLVSPFGDPRYQMSLSGPVP